MKLITQRNLIRSLPERWELAYKPGGSWSVLYRINPKEIYKKLLDLDLETCKPEKIAAIMLHDSWCRIVCDFCHTRLEEAVDLEIAYAEEGEEEYPTIICKECAQKLVAMFPKKDMK